MPIQEQEKTPGTLCFSERGALLTVLPVLECDGMKTFLRPADIHTDDDGTGIASIHADSRGRKDSQDILFYCPHFFSFGAALRFPSPLQRLII
jgi:hypothetical protein